MNKNVLIILSWIVVIAAVIFIFFNPHCRTDTQTYIVGICTLLVTYVGKYS